MSAQMATSRRAAALAAANKLGPMRNDVADAIERHRTFYAEKRATRSLPEQERRASDRRSGHDRRSS
jgi:hypothetical protein